MSLTESKTKEDVYFQRQVSVDSSDDVLIIDQKFECDVGCVVWDAALVLAKYLDFKTQQLGLNSANVVELGSGTGFCGLMAATLGSNVIITDLHYCLDIMQRNVSNNRHLVSDRVVVKEYDWSQTDHQSQQFFDLKLDRIDLILVSDCIYYPKVFNYKRNSSENFFSDFNFFRQSVKQLFDTILWLSSKGAKVLLSFEERDDKQPLIDQFFKVLFKFFNQMFLFII